MPDNEHEPFKINMPDLNILMNINEFTPNQLCWMAEGLSRRMDYNGVTPGGEEWTELDAAFHVICDVIEALMGREWLVANVTCPQQ